MILMTYLLYFATVVWVTYCAWFTIRAKWWKIGYGRNVMGVSTGLTMMLVLLSLLVLIGWKDWYVPVWIVTFAVLAWFGIHRTYLMEKIQRDS